MSSLYYRYVVLKEPEPSFELKETIDSNNYLFALVENLG